MTVTMTASVSCPRCGSSRSISTRQRRRVVNGGGDFTCAVCRSLEGRDPVVEQRYRDYWLERYPVDWILDVGNGIWGHNAGTQAAE